MERKNGEIHVDDQEARAGSTPHIVRYVLIISVVLAIVVLSIIWITGAATTTDVHDNDVVEAQAAAESETVAP